MEEFLKETKYLNFNDPKINELVIGLTKYSQNDKEKALAIHDYVRDHILFGFNKKFYDMTASEVFEAKRGFCNNKSTLFVAMLRAAGIPSRIVFVDIDKKILNGIVDPRTDFVDHTYSEVYLNGKWIKLDSYIVDSKLFSNAKAKLESTNDVNMSYGVHKSGNFVWDGETDSFSQYVIQDAANISKRQYGYYDDIGDFYDKVSNTWNKANFIQSAVFFLFSGKMNQEIEKIRNLTN